MLLRKKNGSPDVWFFGDSRVRNLYYHFEVMITGSELNMPPKAEQKRPGNRYYQSVFGLTFVSYVRIELSVKTTNTNMLLID